MPIIASAIKRVRTAEQARVRNVATKSVVRQKTRAVLATVEAKDAAKAQVALTEAISQIDRAVKHGVLHKNTAARRKSQLARAYNAISKAPFGTTKAVAKTPVAKSAAPKAAAKTPTKAGVKTAKTPVQK